MNKTILSSAILALLLAGALLCPRAFSSDADERQFLQFQSKALLGDADAQWKVGTHYFAGYLVPKDYAEAVKWYRKAAEQGHAPAQVSLGIAYFFGQGVEKDYVEAYAWYNLGSEKFKNAESDRNRLEDAMSPAQIADAQKRTEELRSIFKSRKSVEVVKLRKAGEEGNAIAQFRLGVCYHDGDGVPKDNVLAVKWYRMAAEQGHAPAQSNLGLRYYNGEGVAKDYVEAYAWSNLASATEKYAAEVRDNSEKMMSPQQIADAQKRTRELRAMIEAKAKAKAGK